MHAELACGALGLEYRLILTGLRVHVNDLHAHGCEWREGRGRGTHTGIKLDIRWRGTPIKVHTSTTLRPRGALHLPRGVVTLYLAPRSRVFRPRRAAFVRHVAHHALGPLRAAVFQHRFQHQRIQHLM